MEENTDGDLKIYHRISALWDLCPKKGKILCLTRYETSKKINFEKEESHFNLDKKDVAMTRTSYATAFFYQNAFS